MLHIKKAETEKEIEIIRLLFLEYAQSLNFDLCFQNFSEELAGLPGEYSSPDGTLLISSWNDVPVGCVALRKIENKICEMKRLYVQQNYRGKNIGKALTERLILEAREMGYCKMRLDTVPSMQTAQRLYMSLGFYQIESYCENPIEGAIYMEIVLKEGSIA